MSVSHIPGPWVPYPQATADHYVLLKDNNWFAAIHFNGEMMEAKQMANLQVMAAAPDLLEAAIEVEQMIHAGEMNEGSMEVLRAAIAKATGHGLTI